MRKKSFLIWLRLNWLKLLLILLALFFIMTVFTFLIMGFSSFAQMESFSRKQMMAQMGIWLFIGLIQGVIMTLMYGVMYYYIFMGGGMARMLGSDSAAEDTNPDIHWQDVIGMETTKRDAWEIVEFLRDQTRLKAIGGKIIKGTLFMGPPGCGKTYLAKAIATEVDLPFLSAAGSEFVGMIVGQGAARMRSLFKKARKMAKIYGGCIIFIDEMDSFATPRRQDMGFGGQTSHNATINQFLTEMDGLRKTENNIVVFAATNFNEEELDPAIIRSGRFDRKIRVDYPSCKDRHDILQFYLKRVTHEPSCDIESLAKETMWFSPADLDSLVREAAIFAQREKSAIIINDHLTKAKDHLITVLSKNGSKNMLFAQHHIYWDDLIGMDHTKKELWEIVCRLRDSRQDKGSGNKLAKAYLFSGPPGTGKTAFIKSISTESGFPIVPLSASELLALRPDDARAAIKRTFEEARALNRTEKGCILYIDSIDTLVWDDRHVSFYDAASNFFLSELDETLKDDNSNIYIIGETCLGEESLSQQIMKPGRFTQKIMIPRPGTNDRKLLLTHFLKGVTCADDFDLEAIVKKSMWFSVNDLRSMVKEAQLLANRENVLFPAQDHFQKAIDKTIEIIEKASGGFIMATRVNIPWDSVIGMDAAKKDAMEVVELLKDRERIKAVGGKVIKGTMLIGPPGCGKTYLAKAIATEASLPFLSVAGSEFVGIYVGTGAERVKQLFTEARSLAKAEGGCIIFIDEIDSFATPRYTAQDMGSSRSHNATVNQFLTELDGLRKQENNIVVLAATNFGEDSLDPAVMRSGRFERVIHISRPNLKERRQLFEFYLKKVKVAEDVNLKILARKTLWFSPADIDHMIREASLISMRNKHDVIMFKDLSEAYDRISYGTRSNIQMTREEKEWTAYHETGHAIIGYIFLQKDDIIKATIIPRAGALGFVAPRGRHEIWSNDRESLRSRLKFGLASYAAEMIKFGSTSTGVGGGPGSDFYKSLQLAHDMVWRWGMGKSGLIGDYHALGNWMTHETQISEKTRETLDTDVQAIMQECMKECFDTLNQHRDLLDNFAQELLKKEELDYDEIEAIFNKFNVLPKYRPPFMDEEEGSA
jgi:cell division protease FtsH